MKRLAWPALVLLYLLHNDLWLWEADGRFLWLPIGLAYHLAYCLLVVGWMVDDSRITPPSAVGMNLAFLNLYEEGEAYTEGEYRQWLGEAGFVNLQRELMGDGMSVICATKQ